MIICVVGLGYVGLPLAVKFGLLDTVYGYDISQKRVDELIQGIDVTDEVNLDELKKADVVFSTDPQIISKADVIIAAIPTPVDDEHRPDLTPLLSASKVIAQHMKDGAIVVYESTVYPGCTERDCVPVLEKYSQKIYNVDFFVGYSPERINPGDKVHTLESIVKVVSGSNQETCDVLSDMYSKVVKAGVHKASSIMVAEAAKIIENTQRDINIGLMNELKIIFDKMNVDVNEVLAAAKTKWNFLPFHPGLVGGHCIGVDPYYLAAEAQRLGYHPQLILSGRRVNDSMASYEANRLVKWLLNQGKSDASIVILGGSFKPDVPDLRNSKVADVIAELSSYGFNVSICEPYFKGQKLFGVKTISLDELDNFDVIVKAVNHKKFNGLKVDYELV